MKTICECGHALTMHVNRGRCDYAGYTCQCTEYRRSGLPDVVIYADGSCPRNGKVPDAAGGWGFVAILAKDESKVKRYNREPIVPSTNNTMEVTAVMEGLKWVTENVGKGQRVQIWTDSRLTIGWLAWGWSRNVNQALLAEADTWVRQHRVEFIHIRGHQGHALNERADELAAFGSGHVIPTPEELQAIWGL